MEYDCSPKWVMPDEQAFEEIMRLFADPVIGKSLHDDEENFLHRESVVAVRWICAIPDRAGLATAACYATLTSRRPQSIIAGYSGSAHPAPLTGGTPRALWSIRQLSTAPCHPPATDGYRPDPAGEAYATTHAGSVSFLVLHSFDRTHATARC